jgi:tripartite-type tricarboxylate transporter receptor subunit TctC
MKCQIITGYKGSKEAGLAVMNKEVDALTISDSSGNDYSQGGRTRVVAAIGNARSELKPDIPTIFEMFQIPPERKWFMDFRLKAKDFGRVFVGPPDMPADKLAYLQKVWRDILTDPEIMAEGAKTQRPLNYETPEKLQQTVRDLLHSLSPEKLQEFNEVLLKKFS